MVKKRISFLVNFAAMGKWMAICIMLLCAAIPPSFRMFRASRVSCRTCAILCPTADRDAGDERDIPLLALPFTGLFSAAGLPEGPDNRHGIRPIPIQTAPSRRMPSACSDAMRHRDNKRFRRPQLPFFPRPSDLYVYALRRIVI